MAELDPGMCQRGASGVAGKKRVGSIKFWSMMLFLFESPCAYQILPASWCVGVVSLAVRGVEQIASQPRNFLSLGQRSCMAYVPSSTYFLKVKCFQYRHKNTTAPRNTNHCCFSCSCETKSFARLHRGAKSVPNIRRPTKVWRTNFLHRPAGWNKDHSQRWDATCGVVFKMFEPIL